MTTPRALLYVETEAGGAACWVDDIVTIEDHEGGCRILLAPYRDTSNFINSACTTQQVLDALREVHWLSGICVPRAVEATKAEERPTPNIIKQCPDDDPITVTVLDTVTNRYITDAEHGWWWWGGPGRDDYARGLLFGPQAHYATPGGERKRFLAIMVSAPSGLDLDRQGALCWLNKGYPPDLLARYDIPTEVQP